MKTDNLKIFIEKMAQENERKINAEKRKKHFQEIGRKGGLKLKSKQQLSKIISFRLSDLEYKDSQQKAQKFNLKLSAYSRMIHLRKELKINEFKIDEILLQYVNNSKKITNLMRHREWNMFENKKEILAKIEATNDLMYQYLYSKMDERNKQ
ncbi:plasmid mobilization protein [Kaistella yonginensis]|uniref:plasmid mobilization protein n=1 Tax=Kaistella yonginensis TaxID=658267 RepID=UPI0025B2A88B|nr:special sigma factor [Kaistella yonginensis]MDN3606720.1 special sigma factor [Kaistella yonginensis]